MNAPEDARHREPSAAAGWIAAVLLLSPLLYVLSIGPAGWLQKRGHLPGDMRSIYAPVVWLHNNTPLEKPLGWYAELWGWY